MTRVKICCISSPDEAALAVAAGASALGLVSRMPSGPGVVPMDTISAVARWAPPGVATFLLTSETTAAGIAAEHALAATSVIQICDRVEPAEYAELRRLLPSVKLVQVIHVEGVGNIAEAVEYAALADALLLDSGRPSAAVKELGGTGRVHDWTVSRRIREAATVPLYLAGGLNPENVTDAIRQVQPFGVDICSGVRTGGRLDPVKLARFTAAVAAA